MTRFMRDRICLTWKEIPGYREKYMSEWLPLITRSRKTHDNTTGDTEQDSSSSNSDQNIYQGGRK